MLAAASFPKKLMEEIDQNKYQLFTKKFSVINTELFHKISPNITFENLKVDELLKKNPTYTVLDLLSAEIAKDDSVDRQVLVFSKSQDVVEQLVDHLRMQKISVGAYFAQQPTETRIDVLNRFITKKIKVLVSTDLCSRGLDFPEVSQVINFNFPTDAISFLHRIGRTGRLNKAGKVTNFIRPNDEFLFEQIMKQVSENLKLEDVFSRKRSLSKKNKYIRPGKK